MRRLGLFAGVCVCVCCALGGCKKEPQVAQQPDKPEVVAEAPEKDAYAEDLERVARIVAFHDEMVKIVKENATDCDALAQKWADLVEKTHDSYIEDARKSDLMIMPENELAPEVEAQMIRLRKRADYVTSDEVMALCSDHEGVAKARGKLFDMILEMDNIVIERRKLLAFDKVLKFFENFAEVASANESDCDQMAVALDEYIDKNIEDLKMNIAKSPSFSEAPYDKVFEGVFTNVMGSNSTFGKCVAKSDAAEKVSKRFLSAFLEDQGMLPGQEKQVARERIEYLITFFGGMEKVIVNNAECQSLGKELKTFINQYEAGLKSAFATLAMIDQKSGLPNDLGERLEANMFMAHEDSEAFKRLQLCSALNPAVTEEITRLLAILDDVEKAQQ